MSARKLLFGTLAGTVCSFAGAFVIFGLGVQGYVTSHTMAGFHKEHPEYIFLIIGYILFSFLISYIFLNWAGIKTLASGFKAGLLIGFCIAFGYDIYFYGFTNLFPDGFIPLIVDAAGVTLVWAIGSAGVGWTLGRFKD